MPTTIAAPPLHRNGSTPLRPRPQVGLCTCCARKGRAVRFAPRQGGCSLTRASFAAGLLGSMVLLGCNAEAPDAVGSRTDWIVDGVRDDTPSVVWLYNRTSGGLCTGTIIAPRVVLTAKHCVQEQGASGPSPAAGFIVGVGSRAGACGRSCLTPSTHRDRPSIPPARPASSGAVNATAVGAAAWTRLHAGRTRPRRCRRHGR